MFRFNYLETFAWIKLLVSRRSYLVLCLLFLTPLHTVANPDREQPIYIESDRAQRDEANGVTTYEGQVVMTQGSLKIQAEKVVLYSTQEQGIQKAIATGTPARFEQQPDKTKPKVKARANTINYSVSNETVNLTKNAWLEQDSSTFEASIIDYNMKTEVVNASGGTQSQPAIPGETPTDRIRVVIPPPANNES